MTASRASPHLLAASLCVGLALANLARGSWPAAVAAGAVGCGAIAASGERRLWVTCAALVLLAWWWGSARLQALDRSVLLGVVDTSERARVVVTAPARRTRFELRVPGQVRRFGRLRLREAVLLELPPGRAPPQGAVLDAVMTVRLPRPPKDGFDERTWLRRRGVHVVLRADRWRMVGRRGGLGGLADRLRAGLAGSIAPGLTGDRRGIVEGVVLGDEQALSDDLRQRFRTSGLYHLLSVAQMSVEAVAPRRVSPIDNPHAAARRDGSREWLERLEPATGQGISRAFGRDLHGQGYPKAESRCVTRALGPGLPDPKGTVNGDVDVWEIREPRACRKGSEHRAPNRGERVVVDWNRPVGMTPRAA